MIRQLQLVDFMYKILFKGMPGLSSGYGKATILFAKAFYKTGLDVEYLFSPMSHYNLKLKDKIEKEHNDFKKFKMYSGRKSDICFTIRTPEDISKNNSKYNILYFYWETDTLPSSWVKKIHQYDEIWVPCKFNEDSLRKISYSGVVRVIPTPSIEDDEFSSFEIPHRYKKSEAVSKSVFKFYYIFQWHYRKGFDVLLRAYNRAFSSGENVMLILKTNKVSGSDGNFVESIKSEIISARRGISNFPEIFIINKKISNDQISYLHKMCDVYVSPYRGEGWGMPIVQAAKNKNGIITTGLGGFSEMLNESSAIFIDHKMLNVKNMSWSGNLYTADQRWAEPNEDSLVKSLKYAYNNRKIISEMGIEAKKISDSISIDKVSEILKLELSSTRFAK
jgi:hypothetical protein